jgi:hypothetical protein
MSLTFQTPQARRHFFAVTAATLVAIFATVQCSGKHGNIVQNDEGETAGKAPLASTLKMADPTAKEQLTKGFYGLEANTWRWTAGNFSVTLKTPPGAAQKGATLTLSLTVLDSILKRLHSQSLTASIGTAALKSENYVDPGSHTFTADIPAALLTGDTVTIDFSLDNSLPPGLDRRELGVIVSSVGIESN